MGRTLAEALRRRGGISYGFWGAETYVRTAKRYTLPYTGVWMELDLEKLGERVGVRVGVGVGEREREERGLYPRISQEGKDQGKEPTHPRGQVGNASAPLRLCARLSDSGAAR